MSLRRTAILFFIVNMLFAGDYLTLQLKNAPFPHPMRAAGHSYHGRLFSAKEHYSDSSVLVYVPTGFRAEPSIDYVIHFHGWYNTKDSANACFRLSEQFDAAHKNALLIIPEGPGNAPDSFGGKLSDPGGLDRFMAELADSLLEHGLIRTPDIGRIILTGHSGGYSVIGHIVQSNELIPKIREIHLYDGLYGLTESYFDWMRHSGIRFVHITTDHGGTTDETGCLKSWLNKENVPYTADSEKHFYSNPDFSVPIILLHSDLSHNEVLAVRNQYNFFIRYSCLSDIK